MISYRHIFKDRRFWWGAIAVLIVLIGVLDRNNLIERGKLLSRIHELEAQRDYYRQRISEDSTLLENLKQTEFLEKYAREHFFFRKEGETVYVVK